MRALSRAVSAALAGWGAARAAPPRRAQGHNSARAALRPRTLEGSEARAAATNATHARVARAAAPPGCAAHRVSYPQQRVRLVARRQVDERERGVVQRGGRGRGGGAADRAPAAAAQRLPAQRRCLRLRLRPARRRQAAGRTPQRCSGGGERLHSALGRSAASHAREAGGGSGARGYRRPLYAAKWPFGPSHQRGQQRARRRAPPVRSTAFEGTSPPVVGNASVRDAAAVCRASVAAGASGAACWRFAANDARGAPLFARAGGPAGRAAQLGSAGRGAAARRAAPGGRRRPALAGTSACFGAGPLAFLAAAARPLPAGRGAGGRLARLPRGPGAARCGGGG